MAHRLRPVVVACGLCFAATLSAAELADPTRPPPGFVAEEASSEMVTGPVLQSVLIPKKGRAVAVIGGQQVRQGEMFGESRLIRLTEREAILEGPNGVEHLLLTPGVEKTNIVMKKKSRSPAPRRAQSEGNP